MDQILTYLKKTLKLTDKDWQIFSSKLEKKEFPKKYFLLKTGQTENYLYFLEEGILRFYFSGEENDITFRFAFGGTLVSAYDSFLTQQPAKYNVEALAQTTIWRISYDDLQTFYKESDAGNTIGRIANEKLYLQKSKRELSLLMETAEQRYLNLFAEHPHLLQLIPLKYIASYIGITPQALSRIRKRIS